MHAVECQGSSVGNQMPEDRKQKSENGNQKTKFRWQNQLKQSGPDEPEWQIEDCELNIC
jgi:hypothetical protein